MAGVAKRQDEGGGLVGRDDEGGAGVAVVAGVGDEGVHAGAEVVEGKFAGGIGVDGVMFVEEVDGDVGQVFEAGADDALNGAGVGGGGGSSR